MYGVMTVMRDIHDGKTQFLQTPALRLLRNDVIGLYNVRTRKLHTFQEYSISHHPKRFLTVGRARHSDIRILDRAASSTHCLIRREDHHVYTVEDTGSTNGLYVNDIRVKVASLMPGSWLIIGSTELIAIGVDGAIPLMVRTKQSFMAKAATVYGSLRKAARSIGASHSAVAKSKRMDPNRLYGDKSE